MTRAPRSEAHNRIGYYGDFFSRLIAFMLDAVTISISFTMILWLINVTVTTMQFRTILGFSLREFPVILDMVDRLSSPESIAAWAILYTFAYHVFFTTLTGQTIGKALMGLRVVAVNGKRISLFRAIVRFFAFLSCVATLFLGLLWVFVDNERQGLHDIIARTYVIYTWDAMPDETFLGEEIYQITGHFPDGYHSAVKKEHVTR